MNNENDDILRQYMEKMLALRREREREELSDDDLKRIALDSGMTEEDIAYVERKLAEYMGRGEGYARYGNWDGAVNEFEQAEALAPSNATLLAALSRSYMNRHRLQGNAGDLDAAEKMAHRCLRVDPVNDIALRVISEIKTGKAGTTNGATGPDATRRIEAAAAQGRSVMKMVAIVAVAAGVLIVGIGVFGFLVYRSGGSSAEPPTIATPVAQPRAAPSAPVPPDAPKEPSTPSEPTSRLAQKVMEFGQEGIGAGMFTDARSVGADGAGHIYVGEYSSGRIQVFDASGAFKTQWNLPPKTYLRGMTANREGTVFTAAGGKLMRYDGATGTPRGAVRYQGGDGFIDVAPTIDGGIVAAWDGWYRGGILINPASKDDIVRFDAAGKAVTVIHRAVSSISDGFESHIRVAADGLGNIFALSESGWIYKFGPNGKYLQKFGGRGDQPGQLRSPDAIAVDGFGRVLVADFGGVSIFDADGRFIEALPVRGAIGAMAVTDKNELIVQLRHQVQKFALVKE